MQSHQNSSWSWRNNLKLKGTFLPFIQRNYKVIKKLSFWHSLWEKLGLILSEVVDYNLRMNFGIPDSTVVDDCLHGDKLVLPYTSSVILRLLWSEISMNFKVRVIILLVGRRRYILLSMCIICCKVISGILHGLLGYGI